MLSYTNTYMYRSQINNHYHKCGSFLSLWETDNKTPERLWQIKNVDNVRGDRAERKSVLWIERMIKWHVQYHDDQYDQLLSAFFLKYKQHILDQFGWKRIQLNFEQAHEYQQIAGLHHWQMRVTQAYFRRHKEVLLFPNAKDRFTYRKQFWVPSAQVHFLSLQATQTCVNRQQMVVQKFKVYHINEIESLGQLCSAIFNNGRFEIQQPLSKQEWLYFSGWDKSVQGIIQTGCFGITKHYHGKYSSLLQTLTSPNVAENEANYREINNHWHKKQITNRMLKFPSIIIFAIINRNDSGDIVSKLVQTGVMSLEEQAQKQVDNQHIDYLSQQPSPAIETLSINERDIHSAINADDNITVTQQYWQNRSKMFNLNAFLAVELPKGFTGKMDVSLIDMSMAQLNSTAFQLLDEGKSVKYRFQSQTDKKVNLHINNNNNIINENKNDINNNNDMNNNSNDNNSDITIVANKGKSSYNLRNRHNNNNNSNINDNDNNNNSSDNNSNHHSSESEFDLAMEPQCYDTDGEHIHAMQEQNEWSESSDDDCVNHILHPLHRWNFNANSKLNRMAESDWKWRCKHYKASAVQGNVLYRLSFDEISTHEWNVELPKLNTTEMADTLDPESLFHLYNGVEYIYLPHEWIPNYDGNSLPSDYLFGVTQQNFLIGFLQLRIISELPGESDRLGNNNGNKCMIYQRCHLTDYIDMDNVTWNENDGYQYLNINTNDNLLDEIGSSNVGYDDSKHHQAVAFRKDLNKFKQFDNSAKNMVSGITKSTSSNPCSTCEANGYEIYSFPTPTTMCWKTRISLQTVIRAMSLDKSEIHRKGCKEPPIWDAPVHRLAPTTLHDYEGIFKVVLDCFKGYINKKTDGDSAVINLQNNNKRFHEVYSEMSKIQDMRNFLQEQNPRTPQMQNDIDELTNKLTDIQTEYKEMEQEWLNELDSSGNSEMQQYLKILHKHKINEYYCLSGSVQGIMCKRICKARKELVVLAKNISYVDGILWELLLENLNFLYLMLKRKYHVKFNVFELASMKHSYIDFYHQLVLAVRCWKEKGDLTIKPHYLCHDLEHALHLRISTAFIDEEKIENCHQHVKAIKRLYTSGAGNQHACREMLVGRRMNDRVLSCG